MDVLPAIDLRDGKVVRLSRGDYSCQTTYSDDPAGTARQLELAGARWIHVVDLDAARAGRPMNTAAIRAIREAVGARLEVGGGARDEATIRRMLDDGVDRVVVGSAALRDWDWFASLACDESLARQLALGLDAREGRLAASGWTEQLDVTAVELARRVRGWPLGAIVYTDIHRDGMLTGVNIEATAEVVEATDVPVIASGGVGDVHDVRRCRQIGCGGVIIGKAWYEGRIDLTEAFELAGQQADGTG